MNSNWKNRPKLPMTNEFDEDTPPSWIMKAYRDAIRKRKEWDKGFEKELRELLEKCPRLRKEILGE